MRRIAIFVMSIMLKRAKKKKLKCNSYVVAQAYDHMIKTYESTITFLKYSKS